MFIATNEFESAAEAQATALGADPVGVFVAHPIQDRTDEELQSLADDVLKRIVAGLTS